MADLPVAPLAQATQPTASESVAAPHPKPAASPSASAGSTIPLRGIRKKIAENMDGIKKVFAKYLDYGDGETDALMLNNAEWLDDLNYLAFLRDIGAME